MQKQLSLFNFSVLDELDVRVRRTEINGEVFVSTFDILEYHGNKKNPRQAWKTILQYMVEKQGFSNSPDFGQYQFEGSDGKKKASTPVLNLQGFMRLVQSADVPEWEAIRNWQATVSSDEYKSKAQLQRERSIQLLVKSGYGEHPETLHLMAYNQALNEYDQLKRMYSELIIAPKWAELQNAEYFAVFGMFAKQLKQVLKNESIRQSLGTAQLDTMAFAERRLREALAGQQDLSNERVIEIIKVVVSPLGTYLRGYSELMGVHHITGKPLLGN